MGEDGEGVPLERLGGRRRALVVCTHFRPSRDKQRSTYFMQPLAGLQVASLIDPAVFDVELYHEDWHGPYDISRCAGYDLVFLSGLQVEFDRMRQLSYFFRRAGAKTVAGGSICTIFPEFAATFFDAVCAGGVDSIRAVVDDFLAGVLQPVYRSAPLAISSYVVDYELLAASGISPAVHLVEASRGCSFKCSFCVMPSEFGGHASYRLADVAASIDRAIATAPWWSFRRRYPIVMFLDNNLADDRAFLLAVCTAMAADRRVRGWAGLVTQNILHDRALVRHLAASKCIGLFAGIESFDTAMLKRYRKTQNLSKRFDVIADVAYAESVGIAIGYGLLFDPRYQTAAQMRDQLVAIACNASLPMPAYLSVIAPLAGTASFWDDVRAGALAPGLRLRDLDGKTICYSALADDTDRLGRFVAEVFRQPWQIVGRWRIAVKSARRVIRAGSLNPIRWYVLVAANLHWYVWSPRRPPVARSYRAGSDVLDPQYAETPDDLTAADRERYFDPVELIAADGSPSPWLQRYVPAAAPNARAKVSS